MFVVSVAGAQEKSNENQLALLYYSKGEFQKAAEIYETLFTQTHSQIHFDYLIDCYQKLEQFGKAEKIILEQISYFPKNYYYQVSLAVLYFKQNKQKEAQEIITKNTKRALRNSFDCIEYVDACIDNKQYELAQTFLEVAVKKYADFEPLYKKQIAIYSKLLQYEKLSSAVIDLLEVNPLELEFIKNQLQNLLFDQSQSKLQDILLEKLLLKVNENPQSVEFNELLLWFYLQEKTFKKAFVIARSLDIRQQGFGEKVYDVGQIALSNDEFAIATECFSYVVNQGKDKPYYMAAVKMMLETTYKSLFMGQFPSVDAIKDIESQYIKVLQDIGENQNTTDVIRNLAHIQGFYLHKYSEAIDRLQKSLLIPGISYVEKGLCSMELADMYLFSDDIWSANLLYAKVALDFKNNDIGHQARFKQAQVAYYNAQFEYAQALLDILKASTSKLIANDAFELSLLISENTIMDTSTKALQYFSKADLLLYQNNVTEAYVYLDSIVHNFPGHSLEDDVLMRKAIAAQKLQKFESMEDYLLQITQRFSYDVYADNAHFMLAEYYDYIAKQPDKAQLHYKTLVTEYPSSYFSIQARKRYREIQKL
jgi:hypothetical protein